MKNAENKTIELNNNQKAIAKEVSALIAKAAKTAASTVATLKQAAGLSLKELDNMPALKTVSEKADFIVKVHADDLKTLSTNEKAIFKDSLFLLLKPEAVVEVKPAKGNQGAVHMAAKDAIATISKHALRAAASEIRNEEGKGRSSKGTSNKPKADALTPSLVAAIPQIVANPKSLAELKTALAAVGFTLAPTKATSKRKTEVANIAGMVQQIANMQAAQAA